MYVLGFATSLSLYLAASVAEYVEQGGLLTGGGHRSHHLLRPGSALQLLHPTLWAKLSESSAPGN
jgi:hypothetical protein